MAVECFFCSADYTGELAPLRTAMFLPCRIRWGMQPDIELHILRGSGPEFQRQRRINADTQALNPVYLVADDDCLLEENPFYIQRILSLMDTYPEFAILGGWPSNSTLYPWTERTDVVNTPQVEEHVSVGGIYAARKGVMKEWPAITGKGYDRIQADYLRSQGYRVGFIKHGFAYNHLGKNYSSL